MVELERVVMRGSNWFRRYRREGSGGLRWEGGEMREERRWWRRDGEI